MAGLLPFLYPYDGDGIHGHYAVLLRYLLLQAGCAGRLSILAEELRLYQGYGRSFGTVDGSIRKVVPLQGSRNVPGR